MAPLISIIIPTFNAGKTLNECLKSVEKQVCQNFEVFIVDGKSTDKTLEITENYKSKFKIFQLISESDKGIYDAMNKGVDAARGEWVYFLGSDDTLLDAYVLEKISKKIIANAHVDIIYGNVLSQYYGGIYDGEFTYDKISRLNICHQAIFFRKTVFYKIGMFDLKYNVVADWDHNLKWFFSSAIKRVYVDLVIANFADGGFSTQNEDSLFEKEKNFKLLVLGFNKLSFYELRRLCTVELEKLKAVKSIINYVYLHSYLFVIKGRKKWRKIVKSNA